MKVSNPKWLFFDTIADAHTAQKEMAEKVSLIDEVKHPINTIAGMDVSNTPFDPEQMIFGAVVVASYPSLTILETATESIKQTFPYVPGLLGFREVPSLINAFSKLSLLPDLIMVDGHGISHPRGLGVASHLGVLLDIPTIGVAKSILVGKPASPLPEEPGSMVSLLWKGKEIGMLLRTKKRCSPLIISTGHKITLKSAVELVISCQKRHRLPEPTRYAHLAANACRKDFALVASC
ncbi:MAG: deoxyribonuclease V [Candidatus Protochlamydia sp.]|nr:deoxyribonuclease V [Candidatus Protochlamydia sp.]